MKKPNNISEVMKWVGSHTSQRKKRSSRRNGRKGGRPINPDSARQKRLKKDLTEPNN